MITRRHGQRNLFETVIGPLEKLVEGLVEPALQRLDELLTDEQLMEAVAQRMARRRPKSRTHGRPGTPVEVALRMLVLKRLRGWSFEATEREVRASLVYRKLVRVYFEKVPDAKTLLRLSAVIGGEGVAAIHGRLLEIAREQKLIAGRRARVDTTVVETDIRYPTDSRLLADGIRVLTRALKRIEQATAAVGAKLKPPAQYRLCLRIAAVKLKHVLCQIDPERSNLHLRTLLVLLSMVERTIVAH